jgi:RNA polymerase sigma-70 factor (ECF subfamily)
VTESEQLNCADVKRLVEASRTGDRHAFDELVRCYQCLAMKLAVRILAKADEAADAVQDAFVKAFLGIHKLNDPTRFEPWLLKIVGNVAVSRLRALKRSRKTKLIDGFEYNLSVKSNDIGANEELAQALQQAMAKLPEKQAKAISLFGLQDLTQNEVAEIMNCSVESVRWNVFEARRKLKEMLKDYL